MSTDFEWSFVLPDVEDLADPRLDRLAEVADAVCETHSHLTVATLLTAGTTAMEAGTTAAGVLMACDLKPTRSHPDLVTIPEIAERAGVTRQAVANWVKGLRHGESFPPPANFVNGGVWLWHDVDRWLKEYATDVSDGVSYPTLEDHAGLDTSLATNAADIIWPSGFLDLWSSLRPTPSNFNSTLMSILATSTAVADASAVDRWRRLLAVANWQLSSPSGDIAETIDEFISTVENSAR